MKELYIFCEGRTEQEFCKRVLALRLYEIGFSHVPTIRVAFSKSKGVVHRGGIAKSYKPMKKDILNHLKSRPGTNVFFTSMIDLYGLPKDFPGKKGKVRDPNNPRAYVEALEAAFGSDIKDGRFVPHIQLHEFETLLFADPQAFELAFPNRRKALADLKAIVDQFASIEHIDDGKHSAPSKRIIQLFPEYEGRKTVDGPDIAAFIGLPELRKQCPHFDAWIAKLERL